MLASMGMSDGTRTFRHPNVLPWLEEIGDGVNSVTLLFLPRTFPQYLEAALQINADYNKKQKEQTDEGWPIFKYCTPLATQPIDIQDLLGGLDYRKQINAVTKLVTEQGGHCVYEQRNIYQALTTEEHPTGIYEAIRPNPEIEEYILAPFEPGN